MFVTGLVCLLLVLMITFAGLWLMEKGKTARLRRTLDDTRQKFELLQRYQKLQPGGRPSGIDPRAFEALKRLGANPDGELPEELTLPLTP
jgi:hypothetical protein